MWVMKYQFPCPELVVEAGYLEQVEVHKGIAVCKEHATVDYLFSVGYDEIGQINFIEDLPKFLQELNNSRVEPEAPTPEQHAKAKVVSVVDLTKPEFGITEKPFWWKNVEGIK